MKLPLPQIEESPKKSLALFCGDIAVCGFRGAFASGSGPRYPALVHGDLEGKFRVDLVETRGEVLR